MLSALKIEAAITHNNNVGILNFFVTISDQYSHVTFGDIEWPLSGLRGLGKVSIWNEIVFSY